MKNVYYNNFSKYRDYTESFDGEDYVDLVDGVQELLVHRVGDDMDKHALVMHGFSGNGKSTWIKNFCLENPNYVILSMDKVVLEKQKELGRRLEGMEITQVFSDAFDKICESSKKIIVDGNFLNLFTRMALVDSFHMNGYSVSLVDITPIFDITIESRIIDEFSRVTGIKVDRNNINDVIAHPIYKKVSDHVRGFYEDEKQRANYDEQRLVSGVSIGVEEVVVVSKDDTSFKIGKAKK